MYRIIIAVVISLGVPSDCAANPPPVIHSVDLEVGGPGLPTCAGLAFLPDGVRVAIRWDAAPTVEEQVRAKAAGERERISPRLAVVGSPKDRLAPQSLPEVPASPAMPSRNQVAVTRSGDLVTVGSSKHLLLRPAAPAPGDPGWRQLAVDVSGRPHTVSQLWFADRGDALFVAGVGGNASYELARIDAAGLAAERTRAGHKLRGGGKDDLFFCADLHASGRWFVACHGPPPGLETHLDFWEVSAPPRKRSAKLPTAPHAVAIAPDAKAVAVGLANGRVMCLSTPELAARESVKLGQFTVAAVAYHPGGQYLACGTYDRGGRDNLVVVHPLTGQTPIHFPADPLGILAACFNADGTRLATFGSSGRLTIWDTSGLPRTPAN